MAIKIMYWLNFLKLQKEELENAIKTIDKKLSTINKIDLSDKIDKLEELKEKIIEEIFGE